MNMSCSCTDPDHKALADASAAKINKLLNALDWLKMQGVKLEPAPGWICVPDVEWKSVFEQFEEFKEKPK